MPQIGIADKTTLDTVNTNVGSNADAASSTGSVHAKIKELRTLVDDLETRLTAVRAGYLDYLNNLNTRLTDTRAGKLDLVGTTSDSAGTTTLFARLAQIAGYTDTVETNLGTTAEAASSIGTALQRLAYIINNIPILANVAYASDTVRMSANTERSTTSTVQVLVKRFVVTVAGSVRVYMELKNSVGGGGIKTYAHVYLDGELISYLLGDTTSYEVESCDVPNVKVGSIINIYLNAGTGSTAYIRNTRIEYDLLAPGSIVD